MELGGTMKHKTDHNPPRNVCAQYDSFLSFHLEDETQRGAVTHSTSHGKQSVLNSRGQHPSPLSAGPFAMLGHCDSWVVEWHMLGHVATGSMTVLGGPSPKPLCFKSDFSFFLSDSNSRSIFVGVLIPSSHIVFSC